MPTVNIVSYNKKQCDKIYLWVKKVITDILE